MRNLFIPGADLCQPTLSVQGQDAHHLTMVLRVRAGDRVIVLDDLGGAVETEVALIGKKSLDLRVIAPAETAPEPPISITVAQAIGKGDKLEQVIQHGTEIGVSAFQPILTERTVVKIDARSGEEKRARWTSIAKGAAEQAGRGRIPQVAAPKSLDQIHWELKNDVYERVFVLHPGGSTLLTALQTPLTNKVSTGRRPELLVVVGPEGGFSPAEIEDFSTRGASIVSLGDHVLRTETAALVAVSQILFAWQLGLPGEPGK